MDVAGQGFPGGQVGCWAGVVVSRAEFDDDARELFERAKAAARVVSKWGPEDLWKVLLSVFNSCSDATVTGRRKEDDALRGTVQEERHGGF